MGGGGNPKPMTWVADKFNYAGRWSLGAGADLYTLKSGGDVSYKMAQDLRANYGYRLCASDTILGSKVAMCVD
jgi:hypothetical protein